MSEFETVSLSQRGERLAKTVTKNALASGSTDPNQVAKLFRIGALSKVPDCAVAVQGGVYTLAARVMAGENPIFLRFDEKFNLTAIDRRSPAGQTIERV